MSLVPQGGSSGLYCVNRHFVVRGQRVPKAEAWEDRPLGEALELMRRIVAMEGDKLG